MTRRRGRRRGQVVVEMMLILPIFLTIVFTIMEMGNLAFWVIVLNHATYEVARIGSMLATRSDGSGPKDVTAEMQKFMDRIVSSAKVTATTVATVYDNQAEVMNHDLIVTGTYDVHLVFPISSLLLAKPKGTGHRTISAQVAMPIEQPLKQGAPDKSLGGGGKKPPKFGG